MTFYSDISNGISAFLVYLLCSAFPARIQMTEESGEKGGEQEMGGSRAFERYCSDAVSLVKSSNICSAEATSQAVLHWTLRSLSCFSRAAPVLLEVFVREGEKHRRRRRRLLIHPVK